MVGHTAIAQATPDGYTLGMITAEICMLHWQGLTEVTYKNYTPLGQMNNDPPGIQVNVNSPYKTAKELAEAIKASPAGKFKASGTGQGGIWHLALAGWLVALGLQADHVRWVPRTARPRQCRIWRPAGSTSPPARCPRRAPCWMPAGPGAWR